MPAYEANEFEPPAPVVRAVVRGAGNRAQHGVPCLIDTGADVSLLPLAVANSVGAVAQPSTALIQFIDGREVLCLQADLTVEFLHYRFHGPFLLAECSYGILGRNVLNLLVVTLDGPKLFWSI